MREQHIEGIPYISKEQFYKMAHIRKSTALKLIRAGIIPAIDTGKTTNRYLIRRSDVEFYLWDRIVHPDRYSFGKKSCIQTYPCKYNRSIAKEMGFCAADLWVNEPALLTVDQVRKLIDYSEGIIRRWYKDEGLTVIRSSNRFFIPKKSLLKFIKTKTFHCIQKKSAAHIELIRRAKHEGQ